jgi:hypothetical protein
MFNLPKQQNPKTNKSKIPRQIRANNDLIRIQINFRKIPNKMTEINKYLSIIILNINGSNSPIKRNRLDEWTRRDSIVCCL